MQTLFIVVGIVCVVAGIMKLIAYKLKKNFVKSLQNQNSTANSDVMRDKTATQAYTEFQSSVANVNKELVANVNTELVGLNKELSGILNRPIASDKSPVLTLATLPSTKRRVNKKKTFTKKQQTKTSKSK